MRELALFAGAGGGLLGSHLLGWAPTAACELDARCRDILFARQNDGCLPRFPIWDDVRTLRGQQFRGRVDIVTGGFPCQRFSTASRGRANAVDLWPEMLRVIGECHAPRVLAENVLRKPIEDASADLRARGYHCVILRAPASAVGAPHRRVRWWLAADTDGQAQSVVTKHVEVASLQASASPFWAEHPSTDPDLADGMARGVDVYSRAVGNGQVPQVVAAIGRALGW